LLLAHTIKITIQTVVDAEITTAMFAGNNEVLFKTFTKKTLKISVFLIN